MMAEKLTNQRAASAMLYLDNLTTTPMLSAVRAATLPFLAEEFGNPSSQHRPGRQAHEALEAARTSVASLLGAQPGELYFTPSGTHSNNTALLGRARYCEANSLGKHIVTSSFEHSSVAAVLDFLESAQGWRVTRLSPEPGCWNLSAGQLEEALSAETSLVSIAAVDRTSGALQPVSEIAAIASARNLFFHCDASLLPGRIDIAAMNKTVSAITLSGHKFGAAKGIGALFLRRGNSLMPAVFGGGQEMGYFPGTERLADIVGLGAAASAIAIGIREDIETLKHLQAALWQELNRLPGWRTLGPEPGESRLPGHVSLCLAAPASHGTSLDEYNQRLAASGVIAGVEADTLVLQFASSHVPEDVHRFISALGQ